MKTKIKSIFVALGMLAFSTIHLSGIANAKEEVVLDEAAEVTAEVISIDKENRMVTQRGICTRL